MVFLRSRIGLSLLIGGATSALAVYLLQSLKKASDPIQDQINRYTKLKISVPRNCVGAIIGKNGSVIQELQKASGAKINVSNLPEEDGLRCIVITGTEDEVDQAQDLINIILSERQSILSEQIFVAKQDVGLIIGRSGTNIKRISEDSGARVNIPRSVPQNDKLHPVELTGSPEQIYLAKDMIESQLKRFRPKNDVRLLLS